jgi:hypothetical protein
MCSNRAFQAAKEDIMANGQSTPRRTCGAMEVHYHLIERHPEFRTALAALETQTTRRMAAAAAFRVTETAYIPVVVHVVYNTPEQNISQEQIDGQIEVLNRDYAAKNADKSKVPAPWTGLVADTGIQFALAKKDPAGNATNGVTRTRTQTTSFGIHGDPVKSAASGGADPWPSDRYLNLWVACQLNDGILGYAQFPGMPPQTDGVVITSTGFGTTGTAKPPFNLGRTATHEVGHWLNLRHIWGDIENCAGNDFVDDTPPAQTANYHKPQWPHITCNNAPNGDMFMNYMDYVDDDTMVMFTTGQVIRMHAALEGPRS